MKIQKLFALGASCLLVSQLANAQMDRKDESGWSGDIFVGAVSISKKSLFEPADDYNPVLTSFDDKAESDTRVLPGALGNIVYTFDNINHQLFAGVSRSKVAEGQFAPEIGYRYWLSDDQDLTVALVPAGIGGSAWLDPYVLNAERVETDRSLVGIRAKWTNILGTGFGFEAATGKLKVDEELSGTALGLTAAEQRMLERDSDIGYFQGEYKFKPHRFVTLTPGIYHYSLSGGGAATNFDATGIELSVQTGLSARQLILLNIGYESREHDAANPVFNETNELDGVKVFGAYIYRQPFGWCNTAFTVIANYDDRDSNINFFDSTSSVVAAGLNYAF